MKKTADNKSQQKPSVISRKVLRPSAPSSLSSADQAESSSTTQINKNVKPAFKRAESDSATIPRPKATQPLRSSKISQKLVVFPPKSVEPSTAGMEDVFSSPAKESNQKQKQQHEERERHQHEQQKWQEQQQREENEAWSPFNEERETAEILGSTYGYRTEAEYMSQDERDRANLSRVAAYCTGEGYSLDALRQFLRQHHRVTPRLYDECLYAAYHYPLLTMRPGKDNLLNVRVRSASPRYGSISDDSEMNYDEDTYERNGIDTIGFHLHTAEGEEDTNDDDCDHRSSTVHRYSITDNNEVLRSSISAPSSPIREDMPAPILPLAPKTSTTNTSNNASPSTTTTRNDITTPRRNSIFNGGEVFLFDYGVVVFWNFTRAQELLMLEDFSQFSIRPFRDNPDEDMQIEEMHFQYDVSQVKPRIFNDMITLKSGNHMIKLTLSHGLSQSAVLARYEDIMDKTIEDTKHLPKEMAQTGRLVKNRVEITKINGNLFSLRMNVNLVSNVLDTPEIFWSEPALQPMYNAIRDYLEIPQRVKILNDRLKVISDLLSMLRDHLTNFGVEYQTLIIIYLIIIAVIVACFEIAVKTLQAMRVI
ncbi:hypothetical protein INT45_007778 [Circinella minor]|uniref:DUF155 domain-containing protein n=1 Tax=Circinella minor TaxID=1195481 RepID=A0A8H7RZ77_9FUNG|nr:hypothetical protein INT45_007778 [Circinella minor]